MIDACYTPFVGTHLMHGMVQVLVEQVDDTMTTTC